MENFEDIKIIGLDEKSSKKIDNNKLFEINLILSSSAPIEWIDYFDKAWKSHIYLMKRKAFVLGNILTIICVPDELGKYHLPELNKIIDETNKWYKEYLYQKKLKQMKEEQKEKEDRELLCKLKENLFGKK